MIISRKFGYVLKCLTVWAGALAAVTQANAQEITASLEGKGSAAIVPYYTVNEGWDTLLNLTNTTPNSLAVKVRFLEARNGRDILNFVIALAPNDAWAGWLSRDSEGRPVMRTNDRSCTVPLALRDLGLTGDETGYSPSLVGLPPPGESRYTDYTQTSGAVGRMNEGYVEILVMGEAVHDGQTLHIPRQAEHVNGEPRNCQAVEEAFGNSTAQWSESSGAIPGESGSGDPEARGGSSYGPIVTRDPLKVIASLVKQPSGTAAALAPVHLAGWGMGQNLITAQYSPWEFEPTLASHDGLWSTTALDEISQAMAVVAIENEWTSNLGTGASTDWVVTFPTKRFDADENALNVRAGCSRWRNTQSSGGNVVGEAGDVFDGWSQDDPRSPRMLVDDAQSLIPLRLCPDLDFPTVFQDGDDGRADIGSISYAFYDRETQFVEYLAEGSNSPGALPYSANVLPIGSGGPDSALTSAIPLPVNSDVLGNAPPHGWLRVQFPDESATRTFAAAGFVFKLRDFGNPQLNFSQAAPHALEKP